MALTQVKATALADSAVTTAKLADDAVTLAKQAAGTDGQVITYDASGNPTAVGPGNDGQVLTSTGAGSPPAFETIAASPITALNNATANELVTVGSTTTELDAESTLTYNGSDTFKVQPSSATPALFIGESDRTTADQHLAEYRGTWNGTTVARMVFHVGADTTNKDEGRITFGTAAPGGTLTERLRIDETGSVKVTDGDLVIGTGGHGIDFSAETNTAVSGTTADSDENLNHYEYGTWTAAFGSGGSNTNANCDYIRIGKFVMISGNISVDDISTNANITVTGCPFSCISRDFTGSLRGYGIGNPTINTNSYASNSVIGSADVIEFGAAAPQGMGWEMVFHNDFNLANNNSLRWTLTYITDS